jgi:BioD-like phosphotransacetylase family protein
MASVTLGQIAQHLDGQWVLGQEKAHDLVENFLIGGNIMDSGVTYFGRMESKAVIVRGDRPDIQLAALSTPTTCLILTGGHEPIQYVYHQAEQEEVPLLVVQTDTISAAHALDTVLEGSTIHHPRKLERFQELTEEYVDVAAIQAI